LSDQSRAIPDRPSLRYLKLDRWVLNRFRDAGTAQWSAPGEDELREHFTDRFLTVLAPATVVSALTGVAERLGAELVVLEQRPLRLRAQVADLRIEAAVEAEPPHLLGGLRVYPVGRRVTDERIAVPPTHRSGDVPALGVRVVEEAFTEHGLVGLILAGTAGGLPHQLA
jgi:hypothetical protein